jgi:lipoyl(octanoyl) transferase
MKPRHGPNGMPTIRLLPYSSGSGAVNMARDEALLHRAAEQGNATLRFYTWDEPTLSLGYFQAATERQANLPAWVRRSTGGAAIVHDPLHEITYSLALPTGATWQPPGESWICQMHYLIRDALQTFQVTTHAVICGEEQKLGPVLCFQHQTAGDLTCDGSKVAGSAQRKWKGALLQHGSILLSRSPFAPDLPGIAEQSGVMLDRNQLIAVVIQYFTQKTGWIVKPADWSREEEQEAEQIEREKYSTAEWNEKR